MTFATPKPRAGETTKATERGRKDGFNHALKVMSAEQGRYSENEYPSNPYHQSLPEWRSYNRSFRLGYKDAFR